MSTVTAIATIRAEALAAAVTLAETLHSQHATGTREAAIVAVLDEAHDYWTVEAHGGGCRTETDAREIAEGLAAHLADQAPGLVWGLLPADIRRAARHAVVTDMIGETD